MSPTSRRVFLLQIAATGSAAFAATPAAVPGAAAAKLDEKDPTAVALGYVSDTAKADQKKFPAHAVAQKCNNCALYQGKPADAAGACPIFAGKLVAAGGWCSSWVKKA